MTNYPYFRYKAFITSGQRYILLDLEGDIRGSAGDIEGITKLKEEYGWGRIFEFVWDRKKKVLKVGKEIK